MNTESKERDPTIEKAIQHHIIERDGLHWHVVTSGSPDAPPLLLLHGWGCNWTVWADTITALSNRFHVIAPDHLGFGQSDKPRGDHYAIRAQAERALFLLRHFGYERACVIGHSMGGHIALTLAGTYPDAVERLIVVDPSVTGKLHLVARLISQSMRLARWGGAGIVEVVVKLALRIPMLVLPFMRMYFAHPFEQRKAALYWAEQLVANGNVHSAAQAERSIIEWDVTQLLKKISAPALAIWGEEDFCIPVSECDVLQANIRNIQIVKLAGGGHFPMTEAWLDFKQTVMSFLVASH